MLTRQELFQQEHKKKELEPPPAAMSAEADTGSIFSTTGMGDKELLECAALPTLTAVFLGDMIS